VAGGSITAPGVVFGNYSSSRSLQTATFVLEEQKEVVSAAPFSAPFSNYTIGVPKESHLNEKRVSTSPENVQKYKKMGFNVVVESGAGDAAAFSDQQYRDAGASIADKETTWKQNVILKVRAPTAEEANRMSEGARLISFLYPGQNKDVVDILQKKKCTSWAMELIPRISRAQVWRREEMRR
jgi:H+-translocating NAD(P) transhydrogenase